MIRGALSPIGGGGGGGGGALARLTARRGRPLGLGRAPLRPQTAAPLLGLTPPYHGLLFQHEFYRYFAKVLTDVKKAFKIYKKIIKRPLLLQQDVKR